LTATHASKQERGSATLGAVPRADGSCDFLVWAPRAQDVSVRLVAPQERIEKLTPAERGYFRGRLKDVRPDAQYFFRLGGGPERPDPASRFQPAGVHGPSAVVDTQFPWQDAGWRGLPLEQLVFYEIHVGTFTPEGTFDAVIPRLEALRELGVTAIQLMPVAQFPGNRNWGYDGTYPFAVQNSYGGPAALKRLVNACHQHGLAASLDVVYNHLGPEGNYLADFAPYFTDRYHTPWGSALNFDGTHSDEVRRFFIENALYWITEFHFDALRLDAIHAIVDASATPFLEELGAAIHERAGELSRAVYVIPENDRNDARVLKPREQGGLGLDAQWCDDFHHSLHTLVTGERNGYYEDFGSVEHLARAFRDAYVYTGQYSAYRQRRHGNSPRDLAPRQFVVAAQTHDQVGNRAWGERLTQLVDFESLKLAAGALLLSPMLPLLFMGEEYGEAAPFLYFVSHTDPSLVEAVRKGRREEFARFDWKGEVPDPQDEATFQRSKLNWDLQHSGRHRALRSLYRELMRLRREIPALANSDKGAIDTQSFTDARLLIVRRWTEDDEILAVFSFGDSDTDVAAPLPQGPWARVLDSDATCWSGPGSVTPEKLGSSGSPRLRLRRRAFVLYRREKAGG
jgi:maltooligosyltrehalose trehalohydrolase